LETIVVILCTLTAQQPVLLVMEALHWVKPSTLELRRLCIRQHALVSLSQGELPEMRPMAGAIYLFPFLLTYPTVLDTMAPTSRRDGVAPRWSS